MIQLRRSVLIERDPAHVFALVSDPGRYPEFFDGITRWEPRSRKRRGVGAKFRVLVQVGSIEAGGTVGISDWAENERIAWESEAGIEQRGAWEIVPSGGGSELTLEIEFNLRGFAGWLAERLAGRVVERHMMATVLAARRLLEFESRPEPPHEGQNRPDSKQKRGAKGESRRPANRA
jgi:ribosome-associated toxin RatA of RatAB toxin-antitoxin module